MALENIKTKYAAVITIGCRLNQTDMALIFAELKKVGFEIEKPDTKKQLSLIVVNTCAVTFSASQKSRQYARALKEKHSSSKIIVTGCDAEIDRGKWLSEAGVDIIVPNSEKLNIVKYIKTLFPISNNEVTISNSTEQSFTFNSVGYFPFKSRANIKIQDGCNAYCAYCIVPYARGKPRSREWNNTLEEFYRLLQNGHKEIILTGVNIATYNDSGRNLIALVNQLCSFGGEYRIRLSSTEPQFDMYALIELIAANSKICRFLHLPLQHGSDGVLLRMGRSYNRDSFSRFVHKAVEKIPGICIGTDVIAGFPGETDGEFKDSLEFISSLPISYLHAFKYSKRQMTPAAQRPDQIGRRLLKERHKILVELGTILSKKFLESQKGEIAKVILEINKYGTLSGLTDNYIKANIPSHEIKTNHYKNLSGKIAEVKLLNPLKYREMKGKLISIVEKF